MDPLSTAASGIAVVSLALQLVKSIDDIRTCIRSVKEAPKELIRLNGRLERLGALLKDADHLVQLQAAMPKHLLPLSASITNCLRSCEESLLPLRTKIENYMKGQARNKSTTARLRGDVWLSFKMKDIVNLEAQIQEEIANLTSAVQFSSAILQFSTLPYDRAKLNTRRLHQQQMTVVKQAQNDDLKPRSNIVKATRKSVQVSAVWRSLGLSTQAITYQLRNDDSTTAEENNSVSEEYEYLWNIPFLHRVVRWSQTASYGSLATSISVYPIVQSFDPSLDDLLEFGDLQDFRRLISSGGLHPFTRDEECVSLLHKAARYGRLDICRTLATCGLQPDFAYGRDGFSPYYFFNYWQGPKRKPVNTVIDALRYFLLDLPRIDDFESYVQPQTGFVYSVVEAIEWMWRFSVTVPTDAEKLRLQTTLIHDIVQMLSEEWSRERGLLVLETAATLAHPLLLAEIADGQAGILEEFLAVDIKSDESPSGGDALIAMLKRLGLDHVEVMSKELEINGGIYIHRWSDIGKKISFNQKDDGEWILHWEYLAVGEDFNALFALEFLSLSTTNDRDSWYWPFFAIDWSLDTYEERHREGTRWDARRVRRTMNHTRRELARSGHKRIRSRMPGSWSS